MNLTEKILTAHLEYGILAEQTEIAVHMDQTITQDALGMLTYLALEQMKLSKVQTELSVSYLDHNLLYTDFRNPDDHAYLKSVAKKYGICLSRAGNGICHAVHLSRFAKPGKTVIGTDSHTPSAGAVGMLGFGAGGIEVAAAMAGEPMMLHKPSVTCILLHGALRPGTNAKDAALWLLHKIGVKGGLGRVLEYAGNGVASLSIPERMTLANLGAETGATSSVFPSDDTTRRFLAAQHREADYQPLSADHDAVYAETIELDLGAIQPMVALPHQPDRVVPLSETEHISVDQVFIGSCTNSSFSDLTRAAAILRGHRIAENISLIVSPGTRQTYQLLLKNGAMQSFVDAGARILECGCGPCVGMGQAVRTGGVSVRTSNRNFKGRCGTPDSAVYLVSPETAAATAIVGYLTSAEMLFPVKKLAEICEPEDYGGDDGLLIGPKEPVGETEIIRGPNIRSIPQGNPLPDQLEATVVICLGDNVSTDEIAPSSAKNVANRANIEAVSSSTFERIDPDFWKKAAACGSSVIVAGENYGQGSSREHAALMPMYLGVKAVLAENFARIHRTNLINFGLLPLLFQNSSDRDLIHEGDRLKINDIPQGLQTGQLTVQNLTTGAKIQVELNISPHEGELLLAGGLLRYIQAKLELRK